MGLWRACSKIKEIKNNKEQTNHQNPEKRHKGFKKSKNKETLTLKKFEFYYENAAYE